MATKRAAYANADGTDIELIEADGTRVAVKPGDARLGKMKVAAFVPPEPPAAPTLAELQARLDEIAAQMAALGAGA